MTGSTADILVGIDGSPEGYAALAWALDEARVNGCGVNVVHVVEYLPGYGYQWARTAGTEAALGDIADEVLSRARALARDRGPSVPIRSGSASGPVVETLLKACQTSGLAVFGSRGVGALSRLLPGSVSHRLAAHASCPVVLVPAGFDHELPGAGAVSRVVVGVTDTAQVGELLEFAFALAAHRRTTLLAIRSWQPPAEPATAQLGRLITPEYRDARTSYEKTLLRQALAPYCQQNPQVPVTTRAKAGDAAITLIRACRSGDLLVIGHRQTGRLYPPGLGPVGAQVVQHARSPVAVVPLITAAQSYRPQHLPVGN